MRLRATVPIAAMLLVLSACTATQGPFGSQASGARASEPRTNASDARTASSDARTQCTGPGPTVTAPLVTGTTLPAQPSAPAAGAMAVTFAFSAADPTTYSVQIVDTNGHVAATIRAHNRSHIVGACGDDIALFPAMPLISTSAGRVYYLDGDTDVRYLTPDGSTGLATRVPGSSQSVAMFAVSPDDAKIAVSVFDYRQHPVEATLYVRDLKGSNRTDLPDSNLPYRWPVGWHNGKLIVASDSTTSPTFGFYGALPYRIASLQVLDPRTGRSNATLTGPPCQPLSSLPSTAGIACAGSNLVGQLDWSGNTTVFATSDAYTGGASLSLDGTQLLASGTGAQLKLINSPQLGSTATSLGTSYPRGGGYPGDGGWLDPFHAVYRLAGTPSQVIIDVRTQETVPLPHDSVLAARLPGGY